MALSEPLRASCLAEFMFANPLQLVNSEGNVYIDLQYMYIYIYTDHPLKVRILFGSRCLHTQTMLNNVGFSARLNLMKSQ